MDRSKIQGRQGRQIPHKKINNFENPFYNPTASIDTEEKNSLHENSYFFLRFCPSL
jgi:hypothetical protein